MINPGDRLLCKKNGGNIFDTTILRVFSLKRPTVEALAVLFRVLSRKKSISIMCCFRTGFS